MTSGGPALSPIARLNASSMAPAPSVLWTSRSRTFGATATTVCRSSEVSPSALAIAAATPSPCTCSTRGGVKPKHSPASFRSSASHPPPRSRIVTTGLAVGSDVMP